MHVTSSDLNPQMSVRVASLIRNLIAKQKWLFYGKEDRRTQAVKEKSSNVTQGSFCNLRIIVIFLFEN